MAGRTAVALDAIAEALAAEGEATATKALVACWVMSDGAATVTSAAVGMMLEAVPALGAVEHVVHTDVCKLPFPRELKMGFPGKLVAPNAALIVSATAAVIGVSLAVVTDKEKRGGDKMPGFLMDWGQCFALKQLLVALG